MAVVEGRQTAIGDLLAILDYIADDNPDAAQRLKDAIDTWIAELSKHPRLYRTGRVAGTREMVVHPNYVVVSPKHARSSRYCAFCTPRSSGRRRMSERHPQGRGYGRPT